MQCNAIRIDLLWNYNMGFKLYILINLNNLLYLHYKIEEMKHL